MDITECVIVAEDDVSSDGDTDKSTLLLHGADGIAVAVNDGVRHGFADGGL